ncbi:hypothetical protein K7640_13625 [Micromonospora sp. PLK6-60]|uniref:hypothetical protein n=1 Tax=Micromonospora sp. PLK6-60 TaxID=2873383 RepID=UPI001CA78A82|nr:hypothetical protein [Micromonospora sp. PLK6-60]MBY8872875.1 hypothetical protein [Micromonospora sp. PLK6-60]
MAITSCRDCGTSTFKSVSVDQSGTLAICAEGHYNFDAGSGGSSVEVGKVKVKGQSAIGNGAVAIGKADKKGKKK